ncbi:alpha/beta fold hydrolase [Leifsonia xyli]|uniref:alpha/beta fold hydrolase n=1 Tax=Leifsonia xyli TaxID=1575 RepID=UPI003D67929B
MNTSVESQVRYLQRPEGRVSYTVEGQGPLIVAVPGMGDLRSTFREIVPPLVAAGYRVAVTDLRAHGDSDTTFREFGDVATAHDIMALIEELGEPAVVLGNSMGAGAAAWAAAERPDLIAGLVFYGPLLRDPAMGRATIALLHLAYRAMFVRPWGAAVWAGYYRGPVNRGRKAPWFDQHVAAIRASLSEPGRLAAFRRLTVRLTHSVVEPRLPQVRAGMVGFVGEFDPDYRDVDAECEWMRSQGVEVVRVPDAAHYPQAQRPDITVPGTLDAVAAWRTPDGASWAARA